MRLTFLGTGTSSGVPAIACECRVCTSGDPRDQRLRTGAAVEWIDPTGHARCVLIDTTPDLRQQALKHRLMRCDAVLFTHNHVDHTFGLDEVRRFNAVQQAPIDIYGETHTLDHLRRVFKHIFDSHNNINDSFVATLIAHTIVPETPLEIHGMRFMPIRLLHGRLPIVGFRIEKVRVDGREAIVPKDPPSPFPLAYCTDVSAIPPESWRLLTGLRTLVLDALRHRKHPTHFSVDEAVNAAANIGAESTWFVHMAHEVLHAEVDPTLPEGMHLAWDGLVIGELDAAPAATKAASPRNPRPVISDD
jgi:phosphoribosyl 1,2-cyclic phosphate phosphodiesterase